MDDRRKKYRAWDAQQSSQEPVSPRDALPEDDLVFFLLDLVRRWTLRRSTSITPKSCAANRLST